MHDHPAWSALCAFVNPPERVVAWGGRPGIDVQVGSRHDRRRARHLDELTRIRRLSAARIARLRVAFGVSAASMARSMERFAQAMTNCQAELSRLHALRTAGPTTRSELLRLGDLQRARSPIENARAAQALHDRGTALDRLRAR